MKTNELQNGAYKILLAQFKTHLQTLNYSDGVVKSSARAIKEYLKYIEDKDYVLQKVSTNEIKEWFIHLEKRTNQKTGLGLSLSYLKKIKSCLELFYKFLRLTQTESYPIPSFPEIRSGTFVPKVLTKEEVQTLFKCCDHSLLGKRNKAMLAFYYGCGLRRQEATNLNIEDVDLNKGTVFIAKSKTHRQRIVFMSENIQKIIEDYLFNVREKIIPSDKTESALLISERGQRMSIETAVYVLKKIINESDSKPLKEKKPSIHTLRHSIATHLLQAGMKLENISLFLGHKSMDSTQLYTHLANENR
jgi:integrase/recombinase XerD